MVKLVFSDDFTGLGTEANPLSAPVMYLSNIFTGTGLTPISGIGIDLLKLIPIKTPVSQKSVGVKGEICRDINYLYLCTSTNNWARVALKW